MHPILFHFGPVTIYSYGFFLAVAYLFATFFFWREGRKRGFKEEKLIDFSVAALIAAIIGGRLFYFLLNQSYFSGNIGKLLAFWEGGFAFYGSFVFVLLTGFYLIRRWKWDFFQIADISVLSVLMATFFGKIGSYLAGNDFGSVSRLPLSVNYPFLEGSRYPVQIYEAIFSLVLLIVLYRVYKQRLANIARSPSGAVFFYYLLFSSLGRLIFEQIRGDSTFFGPFKLASLLAITVAILALLCLYYYQFRNFRADSSTISKHIFGLNTKFKHPFGRRI